MPDHPDSDGLLSALIPFAQQMLAKHGEFFPFGVSMPIEGHIALVEGMADSERPSSHEVTDLLFSAIRHRATKGKIRAAAVCYDARVVPPGSSEKVDSICVELEHPSDGCARVFLPYRKSRLRPIKYGDLFGVELSPRVFTMSGPG